VNFKHGKAARLPEAASLDGRAGNYPARIGRPPKNPGEAANKAQKSHDGRPIGLKLLGEYLDLSQATISLVVNNAPGAKSIALSTRARIMEAARRLGYQPNLIARSLRTSLNFGGRTTETSVPVSCLTVTTR